MASNQLKNQHLLWRAGFGPAAGQTKEVKMVSPAELYQSLKEASAGRPPYIDVADPFLKEWYRRPPEMMARQRKEGLNAEDRKMIRDKNRDSIRALNITWLYQMIESKAQLREKMALFWHGHFACRHTNIFFQQQLLDIIRVHALGSFRELLHAVSRSAAMLAFLNAQQNRKDHPNENFAREVMELFTLGRGHYTENDIKEAARAFTGWSANGEGEFIFRRLQHDGGVKTILGKTGPFKGEEVLDLLLERKETARHMAEKVYRFFVNETVDKAKVDWLADRFYERNYAIGSLLEDIFTSDWFYEPQNIGVRIKSPVELIAGTIRALPLKLQNEESLLVVQRLLGQLLFYPPNVAGWPGGKSWIDSSTLMVRMRLPKMLTEQDEFNIRPKTDDDMMGGLTEEGAPNVSGGKGAYARGLRGFRATIQWDSFIQNYQEVPREALVATLGNTLLQVPPRVDPGLLTGSADSSSREAFIRTVTLQLMSLPEYQLC